MEFFGKLNLQSFLTPLHSNLSLFFIFSTKNHFYFWLTLFSNLDAWLAFLDDKVSYFRFRLTFVLATLSFIFQVISFSIETNLFANQFDTEKMERFRNKFGSKSIENWWMSKLTSADVFSARRLKYWFVFQLLFSVLKCKYFFGWTNQLSE